MYECSESKHRSFERNKKQCLKDNSVCLKSTLYELHERKRVCEHFWNTHTRLVKLQMKEFESIQH